MDWISLSAILQQIDRQNLPREIHCSTNAKVIFSSTPEAMTGLSKGVKKRLLGVKKASFWVKKGVKPGILCY